MLVKKKSVFLLNIFQGIHTHTHISICCYQYMVVYLITKKKEGGKEEGRETFIDFNGNNITITKL